MRSPAHADAPDDEQQVGGGQQGAEAGQHHERQEGRAAEAGGRLEGTEHGQHLAPEPGESGEAQGGDGAEGEQAAEAGRLAVEGGAGGPGQGVEVGRSGAVLQGANHEEEQAGDQAVRDVGEQRAVDAGGGHAGDAEQDEAHVADGAVGDQTLEVALGTLADQGEAGERAVDDADGGQRGEVRREGLHALGRDGQRDPHEAVGAHLQQHTGQQHRADGGGGGVRVGQPAVQRPHRGLDGQSDADREHRQQLNGVAELGFRPVVSGECHHVEGAGFHADEEEAEQHHDGAEQRVEDELPGRRLLSRPAPAGDEEVHRDEDHLEGEEEEHQVEDGEGGEGAALKSEQQGHKCLGRRARRHVEVGVERAEEGQQRGQDDEGERDAVDAEVDADVERRDPADIGGGLHTGRLVVVEADRQRDRGGEHDTGGGHAVAQYGLVGVLAAQPGRGREQGGERTGEGRTTTAARRSCIAV